MGRFGLRVGPVYRACLNTIYGCGLRISAKGRPCKSPMWTVRANPAVGKGNKERRALSEPTLEALRFLKLHYLSQLFSARLNRSPARKARWRWLICARLYQSAKPRGSATARWRAFAAPFLRDTPIGSGGPTALDSGDSGPSQSQHDGDLHSPDRRSAHPTGRAAASTDREPLSRRFLPEVHRAGGGGHFARRRT